MIQTSKNKYTIHDKRGQKVLCTAFLMLFCTLCLSAVGQQASGPNLIFNSAANHYIAGQQQQALQTVEKGLRQYPTDRKLQSLHQKLQQQQQQQNNEQEQNDKQENNQQSEEQQKSAAGEQSDEDLNQQGEKKEQAGEGEKQDKKEQQRESEDGEGEEQEAQARDPQGEVDKRLQEMNISPEKAKMMLEAMKSNEIQYLQQKQRQPARRQKSDKPDW